MHRRVDPLMAREAIEKAFERPHEYPGVLFRTFLVPYFKCLPLKTSLDRRGHCSIQSNTQLLRKRYRWTRPGQHSWTAFVDKKIVGRRCKEREDALYSKERGMSDVFLGGLSMGRSLWRAEHDVAHVPTTHKRFVLYGTDYFNQIGTKTSSIGGRENRGTLN